MTTIGLSNPTPAPRRMASLPHARTEGHDEQLRAVLATLEQGIAAILDSEDFAGYLRMLAHFHQYSPNNVVLIHAQRRDATHVAGYRTWQALGRQVKKGERGIRIVVPYRTRVAQEEEGQRVESIAGWGVRTVFDIDQTVGEPVAAPPIHGALTGDVMMAAIVREELIAWLRREGVTLLWKNTGRANGYYLSRTPEIAIHHHLTGIRELKTLVHEAAHFAADHCGGVRWEDAETVAESSAYVVLAHFGMDTGGYSFGYVAHWAREMAVFRRNLAAIQQVAHQLIVAIAETGQHSVSV